MGDWKSDAKQDGVRSQGPAARMSGKAPFPTTGTARQNAKQDGYNEGGSQENPRRQRRQDYTPPAGNQRGH